MKWNCTAPARAMGWILVVRGCKKHNKIRIFVPEVVQFVVDTRKRIAPAPSENGQPLLYRRHFTGVAMMPPVIPRSRSVRLRAATSVPTSRIAAGLLGQHRHYLERLVGGREIGQRNDVGQVGQPFDELVRRAKKALEFRAEFADARENLRRVESRK